MRTRRESKETNNRKYLKSKVELIIVTHEITMANFQNMILRTEDFILMIN